MRSKLFLFFFFLNVTFFFGQKEDQVPPFTKVDSIVTQNTIGQSVDSILQTNYSTENTLYPKKIPLDFKNKYKSKDFDYTTIKPKESLWQKLQRRFIKIWESIFGKPESTVSGIEFFLKILAILIISTAIFFIIKYLMGKDGHFFFSRKNKKVNIESAVLHENIHEINFPTSIATFENKKEFRSAIRYQFLFVLKKMSDQKLIQWNSEKTNTDYITEITDVNQKISYQKLSYIFENVWYGEQRIDDVHYEKLKADFTNSPLSKNKLV